MVLPVNHKRCRINTTVFILSLFENDTVQSENACGAWRTKTVTYAVAQRGAGATKLKVN
jgi:hypothetical protein